MAQLYGPFYQQIWRQALCLPGRTDLFESLAAEAAGYFGISEEDAQRRMVEVWKNRRSLMEASLPRGPGEDLRSYYSSQEYGIWTSLYWHSLRPDRFALHSVAALHALQQYVDGPKVFEFGHGIGSTGILLAREGLQVTLGDVSASYRAFAAHRWRLRGFEESCFFDLLLDVPEPETYDAVVSLDVLEHIPNCFTELVKLWRCLKYGGLLVLNIAFGKDPNNPEHLLAWRTGILDRIRALGMERIPAPSLLLFYKRDLGKARRLLYRFQDLPHALLQDVWARWPKLQRLTSIYCPPTIR
jgi:ubiquinone/menaquinone biosynthesis C-methylase UbiE